MQNRRAVRKAFSWVVVPAVLAIPLALFMVYAALDHNPQEEFCEYVAGAVSNYVSQGEPCRIMWGVTSLVFGVWWAAQMIFISIVHIVWRGRGHAP